MRIFKPETLSLKSQVKPLSTIVGVGSNGFDRANVEVFIPSSQSHRRLSVTSSSGSEDFLI
ncbi:hypothetical protein Hdeb2414_s0011g00370381 [Helianthus debilis subsp. tardiflorus]